MYENLEGIAPSEEKKQHLSLNEAWTTILEEYFGEDGKWIENQSPFMLLDYNSQQPNSAVVRMLDDADQNDLEQQLSHIWK